MFDISDRAEIVVNILQIYKKVQTAGGSVSVKSEILTVFKEIITSRDEKELQEVSLNFITRELSEEEN